MIFERVLSAALSGRARFGWFHDPHFAIVVAASILDSLLALLIDISVSDSDMGINLSGSCENQKKIL